MHTAWEKKLFSCCRKKNRIGIREQGNKGKKACKPIPYCTFALLCFHMEIWNQRLF